MVEFGITADAATSNLSTTRALALLAEETQLDLMAVYDWPQDPLHLETFSLLADLLARTDTVRIFPNVANLQARNPVMLAAQAATLDVLSGGRFELGLGTGGPPFIPGIRAMGGAVWQGIGEGVEALGEAIELIRLYWAGALEAGFDGLHYQLGPTGVERHPSGAPIGWAPGPPPAHQIRIWVGAFKPRMLELVGRLADGLVSSSHLAGADVLRENWELVSDAARAAGREPSGLRLICNVLGAVTDEPASAPLNGPPDHWIEHLTMLAREVGVQTFMFKQLNNLDVEYSQFERFAREVVPGVREALADD